MAEEDSEIESMLSDLDNAILESDVEKDNDFRASNLSKTFRSSSDEEDGFYTTKGNEKNRVEYHESDDSYVDNAYGKLDRIGRGNSAGLKRNIDVEFSKKITKEDTRRVVERGYLQLPLWWIDDVLDYNFCDLPTLEHLETNFCNHIFSILECFWDLNPTWSKKCITCQVQIYAVFLLCEDMSQHWLPSRSFPITALAE
ncbi:hypothetical protein V6N11_057158 [Hibiscus sabdariffa]|uniref:Uncharacterized protein n=2 Tax=Hibiscus sabdariffa TaxID=183260 RepID=A0ABR1ZYT6_9ROSI